MIKFNRFSLPKILFMIWIFFKKDTQFNSFSANLTKEPDWRNNLFNCILSRKKNLEQFKDLGNGCHGEVWPHLVAPKHSEMKNREVGGKKHITARTEKVCLALVIFHTEDFFCVRALWRCWTSYISLEKWILEFLWQWYDRSPLRL